MFLLLFLPVVNTSSDILAPVAGIPVVGGVSAVAGMTSLLFWHSSIANESKHHDCCWRPSVVDLPSVPSAGIVAGLPVVLVFLLWFAFLPMLASLQLLTFPDVAGVPAIASIPAVAVVSAVLVFSAVVGAPA